MPERVLPTGTVTFLFSDMERSTQLVQELGQEAFTKLLEQHHRILRGACSAHGGSERGTEGDSFFVIFTEAAAAVKAAVQAQKELAAARGPTTVASASGWAFTRGRASWAATTTWAST